MTRSVLQNPGRVRCRVLYQLHLRQKTTARRDAIRIDSAWYQLGRQHVQGPVSKVSTEEIFTYWSICAPGRS